MLQVYRDPFYARRLRGHLGPIGFVEHFHLLLVNKDT